MLLNQFDLQISHFDFALFVFAHVLLAVAGYIINDYFDLAIDKVNKPEKNQFLKNLSAKNAPTLNFLINATAIIISFYVAYKAGNLKLGFLSVVIALALYFYSLKYKRQFLTGNIVVSLIIAYTIMVVWLYQFFAIKNNPEVFVSLITAYKSITFFVAAYAIFAFLTTFAREIIKDIEDLEGDRAEGCVTVPVKKGIAYSRKILSALIILIMVLLCAAQIILYKNYFMLFCYIFILHFLFAYLLFKLRNSTEKADFHFLSNFLKIVMLAGLLSTQVLYICFQL